MQAVTVRTEHGPRKYPVMAMIESEGKKYLILKCAAGGYIDGLYTKYAVTPISAIQPEQPIENIQVS